MLKVRSFKQPAKLCGPTSLRMVLDFYGVKITEKEIIKLAKYDEKKMDKKDNTGAKRLADGAKSLGFQAFVKDNSRLEDVRHYVLKKKVPVIVNWFSETEGHYSVVVDIDKKQITLRDPETGGLRKIPLKTFEDIWFDFSPHHIRTPNSLVVKRMIVVER